jgi:hypothetical protein
MAYSLNLPLIINSFCPPITALTSWSFACTGEGVLMAQRAILIVGEDKVLCDMCAKILQDWKTTTTDSTGAPLAILGRVWDLLILCESVEDCDARQIVSQAKGLNPDLRFFAISHGGRGRKLGIPTFEAMKFPPRKLRDAVAGLMRDKRQPSSTECFPFA